MQVDRPEDEQAPQKQQQEALHSQQEQHASQQLPQQQVVRGGRWACTGNTPNANEPVAALLCAVASACVWYTVLIALPHLSCGLGVLPC